MNLKRFVMKASILNLRWTKSRARDSYGYNRLMGRSSNNRRYVTCGGGYDMVGTVMGNWLAAEFQEELLEFAAPLKREKYGATTAMKFPDQIGIFEGETGEVFIDGGYGEETVAKIAERAGIELHKTHNKSGSLISVAAYS